MGFKWHKTSECLPEHSGDVLIATASDGYGAVPSVVVNYSVRHKKFNVYDFNTQEMIEKGAIENVVYWSYVPELPEEGE